MADLRREALRLLDANAIVTKRNSQLRRRITNYFSDSTLKSPARYLHASRLSNLYRRLSTPISEPAAPTSPCRSRRHRSKLPSRKCRCACHHEARRSVRHLQPDARHDRRHQHDGDADDRADDAADPSAEWIRVGRRQGCRWSGGRRTKARNKLVR